MQYLGIDCGLDGGLVHVSDNGEVRGSMIMPTMKIGKGRAIDINTLDTVFSEFKDRLNLTICIEDPGKHAASAMGLWSMTRSFAIIETLTVVYGFRYEVVSSRKWQKEFWTKPKMAKGVKYDTKSAALLAATRLWPTQDWTATERSSKAHDGLVDAALLAEWLRRKLK